MLRRLRIALLVAAVLIGGHVSGSSAAPGAAAPWPSPTAMLGPDDYPGIQPQVPDLYFPLDGNSGYASSNYDIRLHYRFSDGYLSGKATYMVFSSQDLHTFTIDLLLDVDSVAIINGDRTVEAEFHKRNRHEVVVTPARPIRNGAPVDVEVTYHGYPSRIRWNGERNWLANRHEVVTMNRVHMAPWWFPGSEHPSDPMDMDLRVTTDKSKEVISNGELVSRTVHGRNATTHWHAGWGMAPNLAFFAAGDFDIETGQTGHGFTYYDAVSRRLSPASRAASMSALRKSGSIAAWLQREVGDYQYGSTGGVVTSLRPGFAVANVTRPTYPARPSVRLMVHELAQQWFGGRVRISQWADIWLDEGFATYAEWLYDAAHGGPSVDQVLHRTYRQQRNHRDFWDLTVSDPGPRHLFDRRVQVRGAMTLAALRNRFGPSEFRDLLIYWTGLRQGRHSSSLVFELFSQKQLGAHLEGFFDAWLRDHRPPPRQARFGL